MVRHKYCRPVSFVEMISNDLTSGELLSGSPCIRLDMDTIFGSSTDALGLQVFPHCQ